MTARGAALLAAAALAALPAPALADGVGSGAPWPTAAPIRVYNAAPQDQKALGLALAAWNGAGARVRFVQVRSRAAAQVVVRYDRSVAACGMGWGTIGYPGPGGVAQVLIRRGTPQGGQSCAWPGQAIVLTHELGHVLGFGHVERCSVMAPVQSEGRGPKPCVPATSAENPYANLDARGTWRCALLEPFDVARLVRRYGGRAAPSPADPWCDVYAPIGPPAMTAARADVPDGAGGAAPAVTLSLVRPADPAMPDFVTQDPRLAAQGLRNALLLYRTAGACLTARPPHPFRPPEGTAALVRPGWSVEPGGVEVVTDTAVAGLSGPVCYTAWAVDSRARPGRVAAQATVTL